MHYLIVRNEEVKGLDSFNYNNFGYEFKPLHRNDNFLRVSRINVLSSTMIDHILSVKFDSLFKKIYCHVISVVGDDDSTDGDVALVLDEIARLKNIVLNKYDRFLSKKKKEFLLKKIQLLENEAKVKEIMVKSLNSVEKETLGKSR